MKKLKVLIITQDYPPPMGGMQIFTYNLEKELKKNGHIVSVLNFDGRNNNNYLKLSFADFFYTDATKNSYYPINKLLNLNLFFNDGGLRDFVFKNMIYRISKKEVELFKPDIIHVMKKNLYSSIYNCCIPFIVSCHSTAKEDVDLSFPNIYTIGKAKKIHCVSNYLKRKTVEIFDVEESKIRVVYNPVNLNKYFNVNNKRRNQFITVSRMVKVKNLQNLIKAINFLPTDIKKDYTFLFLGDGEERLSLESLVKEFKLENVHFLGEIFNEKQKIELLQESKYFILCPTIIAGHTETFGISFIEAQACGLPVITSKVGGIPEAVGNGGLYIEDEKDPRQIAEKIEYLINNKYIYNSLLVHIKKRIQKFDEKEWFNNMLSLYYEVLGI